MKPTGPPNTAQQYSSNLQRHPWTTMCVQNWRRVERTLMSCTASGREVRGWREQRQCGLSRRVGATRCISLPAWARRKRLSVQNDGCDAGTVSNWTRSYRKTCPAIRISALCAGKDSVPFRALDLGSRPSLALTGHISEHSNGINTRLGPPQRAKLCTTDTCEQPELLV